MACTLLVQLNWLPYSIIENAYLQGTTMVWKIQERRWWRLTAMVNRSQHSAALWANKRRSIASLWTYELKLASRWWSKVHTKKNSQSESKANSNGVWFDYNQKSSAAPQSTVSGQVEVTYYCATGLTFGVFFLLSPALACWKPYVENGERNILVASLHYQLHCYDSVQ